MDKRDVHRGLEAAFGRTAVEPLALEDARIVVFSDLHKGQRDDADDFRRSEQTYLAALEHYRTRGFVLIVLGDAEELWECRPQRALPAYENVAVLERRFNDAGRYRRVFGNHDDLWMHADAVDRYLRPRLGPLEVHEAFRFAVTHRGQRLGELFLVHGHQGTWFSDRNRHVSRWVVRNLWRPIQRLLRIRVNTPASDACLREEHDVAMYEWTLSHPDVVLIAGHTHRPVWTSRTHVQQLEEELARLRRRPASAGEIAGLERRLEERRLKEPPCAEEHHSRTLDPRPSYFNTGCCCFDDGNVTGLEIEGEHVRLIKWSGAAGAARREELGATTLPALFAQLRKGRSAS